MNVFLAIFTTFASFVLSQAAPLLREPYGNLPQVAASAIFGALAIACILRLSKSTKQRWWLLMGPALCLLALILLDDVHRLI